MSIKALHVNVPRYLSHLFRFHYKQKRKKKDALIKVTFYKLNSKVLESIRPGFKFTLDFYKLDRPYFLLNICIEKKNVIT